MITLEAIVRGGPSSVLFGWGNVTELFSSAFVLPGDRRAWKIELEWSRLKQGESKDGDSFAGLEIAGLVSSLGPMRF